jgi:hypothetical protein
VTAALTSVFAEALKGGVSNLSFGELSGQLGRTMYNFQFQIPPFYTLLVRSLSVLEVNTGGTRSEGCTLPLLASLRLLPAPQLLSFRTPSQPH